MERPSTWTLLWAWTIGMDCCPLETVLTEISVHIILVGNVVSSYVRPGVRGSRNLICFHCARLFQHFCVTGFGYVTFSVTCGVLEGPALLRASVCLMALSTSVAFPFHEAFNLFLPHRIVRPFCFWFSSRGCLNCVDFYREALFCECFSLVILT